MLLKFKAWVWRQILRQMFSKFIYEGKERKMVVSPSLLKPAIGERDICQLCIGILNLCILHFCRREGPFEFYDQTYDQLSSSFIWQIRYKTL